jgi:hypothetical protein
MIFQVPDTPFLRKAGTVVATVDWMTAARAVVALTTAEFPERAWQVFQQQRAALATRPAFMLIYMLAKESDVSVAERARLKLYLYLIRNAIHEDEAE